MKTHQIQTRAAVPVSPFVAALRVAILKTVREMRANGDTGASLDCLRQCVKAPSHMLDGAPVGTNAVWLYGELFKAEASRLVPSFLIQDGPRNDYLARVYGRHAANMARARRGEVAL